MVGVNKYLISTVSFLDITNKLSPFVIYIFSSQNPKHCVTKWYSENKGNVWAVNEKLVIAIIE